MSAAGFALNSSPRAGSDTPPRPPSSPPWRLAFDHGRTSSFSLDEIWVSALCKKYRVCSETIAAVRLKISHLLPSSKIGAAPELRAWVVKTEQIVKTKPKAATVHPKHPADENTPPMHDTLLAILQRIVAQYSENFLKVHGARLLAVATTSICVNNADAVFTENDSSEVDYMDTLDECLLILATIAIEDAVFSKSSVRALVAALLQQCFSAAEQTSCQEKLRDLRDQQLSQSDFDVPSIYCSSTGFQHAIASLDSIGEYKAPTAKLLCIVAASQQIADELQEKNGGHSCGADQTMPVYNFVVSRTFVLQAEPLQTLQMLWHLTAKGLQNDELGYCLVQFNTSFDYLVRLGSRTSSTRLGRHPEMERRRTPSTDVGALSPGLVAASIGMSHRRGVEELMTSGMITADEHAKLREAEAELARMTAELLEWEKSHRRKAGAGAGQAARGQGQAEQGRRRRSNGVSTSMAFVAAGGF
jgi:hypothetical protein